jgi:hypothetical protein
MSVQYAVQADVFDIGHTTPKSADYYLVESG